MEICNSAYKANTCLWSYIFTSTVFYVFTETDICDKKKKKEEATTPKPNPVLLYLFWLYFRMTKCK